MEGTEASLEATEAWVEASVEASVEAMEASVEAMLQTAFGPVNARAHGAALPYPCTLT